MIGDKLILEKLPVCRIKWKVPLSLACVLFTLFHFSPSHAICTKPDVPENLNGIFATESEILQLRTLTMEFLQEFEDYSACSLEGLKIDSQRYANAEQTLDSEKKTLVNEVFNKEVNQFNKFRDCTLSSKGDSLNDNGKGDIRKLLGRIVAIRQSGNEEDLIKLRKDFQINATKSIVCNARYLILRSLGEFHIKANNFDTAEIFLSEALKMNLAGSWKIEIQKQLQTAKTTTPTLASTPTPAITTTTPVSAH